MSLEIFDLTGKTAMITGSTKGLGEVAALLKIWEEIQPVFAWMLHPGKASRRVLSKYSSILEK
jgi:NAD(P)-dependent dehydrogenase (short-subunit alcohol dehydrogenase family)